MSGWRSVATEMEERPEIEEVGLRSALKPGIGARDLGRFWFDCLGFDMIWFRYENLSYVVQYLMQNFKTSEL
jgi:hypothetical protein